MAVDHEYRLLGRDRQPLTDWRLVPRMGLIGDPKMRANLQGAGRIHLEVRPVDPRKRANCAGAAIEVSGKSGETT